eukprot:6206270-Pleurochrysis_carterae.AAC.1
MMSERLTKSTNAHTHTDADPDTHFIALPPLERTPNDYHAHSAATNPREGSMASIVMRSK